jgi:hypothetical protein
MIELPTRPFDASVVFLKLRGWGVLADAERGARREQLAATVGALLKYWPDDARFVLETADGMAIVALGHPRLALEAARHAAGGTALAVGLHHGPVQLVPGHGGALHGAGDGLDTAARLAQAADEGKVETSSGFESALRRPGRRAWLGAAGIVFLLGAGFGVRVARERAAAARLPAVLLLRIKPWGDVYIDGEPKGTTPPLNRVWIAPGAHTVEIRHGRIKSLRMDLQLRPGEELELKHSFENTPARRREWWERFKFW